MLKKLHDPRYSYHLTYPKLTVIITAGTYEKANAMAASWHTYLSFEPPLYGVSVALRRYTYQLIKENGDFCVNFLPFELAEKVWKTGLTSGAEIDKFKAFGLTKKKASKVKAPIIEESLTALECKVVKEYSVGDHVLFVGEIVTAWYREGIIINDRALLDPKKALHVYYLGEGHFLTLAPDTLKKFEA
ncbi:MAG: flavin reductase family protein [Candidatus Njordarchaeales archaeon]